MASTYSDLLRLEKQANGENDSTWGDKMNVVLELIEDAITGMATISTTGGTTTLSANNSSSDQARMAVIKVTGVLISNATLVIPATVKQYVIWNATTGAFTVTLKTSGGVGAAITQGEKVIALCDGTDTSALSYASSTGPTLVGATFTGAVNLSGAELQGGTPLVFEGATANSFETRLVITDPTADRQILVPDADVDLSLLRAATSIVAGYARSGTHPEQLAGLLTTVFCTPAGLASVKLLAVNGYYALPGGLILQWGRTANLGDVPGGKLSTTATFPITFPTAVLGAVVGSAVSAIALEPFWAQWDLGSTTTSTIHFDYAEYAAAAQANVYLTYFAVGY